MKPPGTRQRRNRTATAALLQSQEEAATREVPPLPTREAGEPWHPAALLWWRAVWKSPMAGEFLDADLPELHLLADLHHRVALSTSQAGRLELLREIRLASARFGLSPLDRRRLQWEIDKGEDAADRTKRRREYQQPMAGDATDPRLKLA